MASKKKKTDILGNIINAVDTVTKTLDTAAKLSSAGKSSSLMQVAKTLSSKAAEADKGTYKRAKSTGSAGDIVSSWMQNALSLYNEYKDKEESAADKTGSAIGMTGTAQAQTDKNINKNISVITPRRRNTDSQFTMDYFDSSKNPEMKELIDLDVKDATATQAAKQIDLFLKQQAGINYRQKYGTEYDFNTSKELFNLNDQANDTIYKSAADTWMNKLKSSASEKDIDDILKDWKSSIEAASSNSNYRKRLQERYDELKSWAGNNYSNFAAREVSDYATRIAKNNNRIKELGAFNSGISESEAAEARDAVKWIDQGQDAVGIVERSDTLRRITGYDELAKKYSADSPELHFAIYDALAGYEAGTPYSAQSNEEYAKLVEENDALRERMQEAATRRDKLVQRNSYEAVPQQVWAKDAAASFYAPKYSAYSNFEVYDERGNKTGDVGYNEPTLAQIVDDPEAVNEEYKKYRAATGNSGYAETISLARYMTEDEKYRYKAIYAKQGEEAAQEYFDYIKPELMRKETETLVEEAAEFTDEHPVLGGIASVGTNVVGGLSEMANAAGLALGQEMWDNQFGEITNAAREVTQEKLIEATPWANINLLGKDTNMMNWPLQAGYSGVDELFRMLIYGPLQPFVMGAEAGASATRDIYERTGDREAALLGGLGGGLAEAYSEKLGDVMFDNPNLLLSALGEGIEEIASGLGGMAAETMAGKYTGAGSELEDRLNYLRDNGYSNSEALKIMLGEYAPELLEEGIVGAIAGGAMGAGNAIANTQYQNAVDIATGRQIEQTGSISEVLKAGMESTDKAVKRISERLMEKLNLTDASKPVLPNDAQTSAELQFVAEGISEEQRAATEAQQRENNEKRIEEKTLAPAAGEKAEGITEEQKAADTARQQANNEARTEAQMRELDRKEARQLGKVYNKVMQALDVAIEKDAKKLGKTLQSKLKEYGESHIQQVTQAIAEVVVEGENASKEAVDIAEAAAMRDGAIKTVFEAYKQDAARLREFIENGAKPRAQQAMQELPARMQEAQQGEDAQAMPEAAQEGQGSISYTTETGDVHRGEIEGFAINEGGGMDAVIDGERVPVDNLVVDDGDRENLIRRAAGLQDAEAAKLMYDSYERGQDMSAYAKSFETAYHYGEIGLDEKRSRLLKGAKGVTDAQFAAAYAAGAAQAAAQPQQSANTSGGKVSFAEGLRERVGELDSRQQSAIDAMSRLAETTGTFNVEFFESQADENGSYRAWENGSYDPATNTLRFDVNAGKNSETDISQFAILRTASHELTHYMKAHNPEGFRQLLNYVAENLYNDSENAFDDLVELKMEQQGLSYAAAAEEVVSNGSEMMMRDSTAVQQFAERNMSLFKKVQSWLANFVESVKRAFHGVSAQSIEARMLKNAQEIQKIWDDALVGAMENVRKGGMKGESASAETDTQTKYSRRDAADDAEHIKEAERFFGTTTDFREAGYLLTDGKMLNFSGVHEGGTERGVRHVDHRDIWDVRASNDFSGIEAMVDFMNMGNIRLLNEYGGINLQQAPTKVQETVLKRYVSAHNGYVIVDVDDATGKTIQSFEYDKGTNGTRVINDIRAYFTDGTIPKKQSGIGNFLYDDGTMFSERTDALSDREILAQAFESVAANDAEREMLAKYQSQIETLDAKQVELKNVRARIEYLTKNTPMKDAAYKREMAGLRSKERALANKVNATDKTLIEMEHAKPLQDVVARESAEYAKKEVRRSLKIAREHRDAVELRRKIRNLADDFDRKLLKPTTTNYIPKEMARMVVAMRELVDVNGKRKSESARAKIDQIKEAYQKYKDDPQFEYVYDSVIDKKLEKLKTEAGDADIYHMDKATLQDAYEVMKEVRKQVSDAVKLKSVQLQAVKMQVDGRDANIFDVGKKMYLETMEAAPLLRGKMSDYLQWQLTPDKFFSRLAGYAKDSAWEAVGKSFRDGTQRKMEIQREAQEHFAKWFNSEEADRLNSTKEKDMIDIGLRDEHGDTIKITRGMMLEAYMHLSSEDNAAGFMYGGFSVPNLKKYYAGKVGESYGTGSINATGTAMELPELQAQLRIKTLTMEEKAEIGRKMDEAEERGRDRIATMKKDIEGKLTDWDRGLIKAIHEWNDGRSRDLINEVTMDIYGTKRAGVQNYYPIHRDRAFVNTDFDSISRNMNLENWGSLKDRVPSRAPILLGDVLYTMDNSVNQMSRYVGYARAQRDFNKLYNIRMPGMAGSVKKAVEKKFGTGERGIGVSGTQYIENYIGNITGSRARESDFLQAIRRNLPRATMSANLRVGFSQFSAITKAAQEVGWGNLAKGMAKGGFKAIFDGKEQERLAKQNVWFWTRRQGEGGEREFADMKGGNDPISKAWNWVDDKTGGWLLNLNQKIDVATTAPMWYAAKEWTKKNSNAREGTAEFDAIANEKYTDILRNTQAANTISEMSDLQRGNKGGAMSILTMYKSEAFANFNIMYDAIVRYRKYAGDLKAGKNGVTKADVKQAKLKIANGVTSVMIGSSLLNAAIKLAVNAIFSNMNNYRDDEDEVTMESIAKEIGLEMLDDATGMVTFGGEAYDLLAAVIGGENYDPPSLAALDELTDVAKTAVNLVNKDDATMEDYMKAAEKTVMSVGTIFGIPIENTKRQVKGIINTVQDIYAGDAFRYEASVERKKGTNYNRMLSAAMQGDDEKFASVMAELEKSGVNEKDARAGYRGKLKKAYEEGKVSQEDAMQLLVDYGDKDEDEAYWQIQEWDYEGEKNYSKYADLRTALAESDRATAAAEIAELRSHGVDDEKLTAELTKLYNKGEATSIMTLQLRPGRLYTPTTKKGQEDKKDDYNDFLAAVLSGQGVKDEIAKLRKKGYSTKNMMSALNGAFGKSSDRYATMMQHNPTEGKVLEERILDAYEAIGLDREQEREWIHENWTMPAEEEGED